jgi:hypothetical protein
MALVEYWVTFIVLDDDALALERALHEDPDERIAGVIREDPNEGTAMVAFRIVTQAPTDWTDNPAYRQAMEAYAELRRNARLPEGTPGMATTTDLRVLADDVGPPMRPPASLPHEQLLVRARTVRASGGGPAPGRYGHAVLLAQAACEMAIARAVRRLIAKQAADLQLPLEELISNRWSLSDTRVGGLWNALAVDDIYQAAFWQDYKAHLARRQVVVHEGATMSVSDADASIDVAQDVCDHVTALAP